ncbi:CCA tRNA nucleotidyltransferase, partial [Patescibacteria group bacterium]|nr:CCA tRNA nucleotidyltransferase [Patescibacteria group bacterium]
MINEKDLNNLIPQEVSYVTRALEKAGFEAFLVGGCVRDMLLDKKPKDWDITTNAIPEQIIPLFEKTFYENEYGTVGVVNENTEDESLKIIEVTPYRLEAKYSDNRRPDSVTFSNKLEEDLQRRDFTINAIAYNVSKGHFVDPYKGQKDIKDNVLNTVGVPYDRFNEDALRVLRAIRLAIELSFIITPSTQEAIKKTAYTLQNIAKERICDEFVKIIESETPMEGIILAHELEVLQYIVPELEEGIDKKQNGSHVYTVWEHNLRSLRHATNREWPLHVKLAALFHDIGKPATRRWSKEKNNYTFYGHDVVGGRMTQKIMERLKFPKKMVIKVSKLVRFHLFFSDIDKITLSAVRRIVRNVEPENVWDLMKVRACDRIGMGRPKESPYRLRKYKSMIEEAMRAPVSVQMLKIDGATIMDVTHETPGPKIGFIL